MGLSDESKWALRDRSYISPGKFYVEMKELSEMSDKERAHAAADLAVCQVLEYLGYEGGVGIYREMVRWCA